MTLGMRLAGTLVVMASTVAVVLGIVPSDDLPRPIFNLMRFGGMIGIIAGLHLFGEGIKEVLRELRDDRGSATQDKVAQSDPGSSHSGN